ncbi:MAG: hypothetical protein IAG13_30000 [Deltaproteobacteria bacterium]|nr:hypothetical protein [Nannocystaceae bacterium]
MPASRPALSLLVLIAVLGAPGCGENKRDVFMQGLEIEGAAERGPCRLHYADDSPAAALSGDMVAECLRQTEFALALYDKAATLGLKDPEFIEVHERAQQRRERLEGMLKMVRGIETDQLVHGR